MKRQIETGKTLYRTAEFDRAAIDDTARTVRLSISSDTPYLRRDFFGNEYYEVLRHDSAGVVIDRLSDGTALLWNHLTNQQLGRQISFENDGHKITVISKFSRSEFAEEKFQDVRDGILQNASVGYQVLDAEETDEEIDGIPIYKMKWQPLEHSLVPVAADITVGVGRSREPDFQPPQPMNETTEQQNTGRTETQERERITEILAIAKRGNNLSEATIQKAIGEGTSSAAFRKYVFENHYGNPNPLLTPGSSSADLNGNRDHRGVGLQIITHSDFRRVREGGRKMVSFELPDVRSFREAKRSTVVTDDIGTTIQQVPGVQGVAFERLTVADLIAPGTTTSGKVMYPREVGFSSGATTVPEGATKPEQAFDVEPAEASAKKIAAWAKISDELLEDSPAAASYVENRLGFAVQKAEDMQLLLGDGIGSNMKGILSVADVQLQVKGADTAPDAIRKAIGAIDANTDFIASGIVLHPNDWMEIEMLKDTTGRYLVGQILVPDEFGRARLAPSLWGKPIAISKSITEGHALVGAFNTAAQLFRRKGLVIEATNSNEDDFKRNLVLIRAELRAALAVYAGAAFCEVTGI